MSGSSIADLLTHDGWAKEPRVLRGFSDQSEWVLDRVHHACQNFSNGRFLPKLRVFVDNGNRTDLSVMLAQSPIKGSSLHEWVSNAIGRTSYCLAFNGVTSWDEPLASHVRDDFVAPLLARLGRPIRGFDVYIFAGCYDITPFGIHKDSEPSLLLHLGPASKGAYMWDKSVFQDVMRNRELNEFDLGKWVSQATHFELAPGDLLYLPAGHPHVMTSQKFSVTLGVVPNNCDAKGLLVEVAREMADTRRFKSKERMFYSKDCAAEALRSMVSDSVSFLDASVEALHSVTLRLESNGYLVPPPAVHERISGQQCDNTSYRITPGYPLFAREVQGWVLIYARGQICSLRGTPGMVEWVTNLNRFDAFGRDDAVRSLASECDSSATHAIVDELLRLRAIEEVVVSPAIEGRT